jgi:peroxiredoxin Q/BCP
MMKLKVGDPAPQFTTTDQDGKPVSLSDFKGKKVVLYFYPNDMTPGCTAEACSLRDNYRTLQKQGYVVLGISTNDEKSHKKFIAKEELPFSLLADTNKSVHEKYGTWGEKSMYGRKYMGTFRVTFVIDEKGIIREIIEKVDTKNHASQILDGDVKPAKVKAPVMSRPPKKATKKVKRKTGKR